MYDFWLRSFYDKLEPDEVFPSEDLLDEIHVHDAVRRDRVSRALNKFMSDFQDDLHGAGVIECILIMGYEAMRVHKDSVLFYTARPADNRFVFGS